MRARVGETLSTLLNKEQQTRDRLQALEVRLKPLLKTVHAIAERADLRGKVLLQLRAKAVEDAHSTTERIGAMVESTEYARMRCNEFLLATARQTRRSETLVGREADVWESVIAQEMSQIDELREQVLQWIETGEERYLGIIPTELEDIIPGADDDSEMLVDEGEVSGSDGPSGIAAEPQGETST